MQRHWIKEMVVYINKGLTYILMHAPLQVLAEKLKIIPWGLGQYCLM